MAETVPWYILRGHGMVKGASQLWAYHHGCRAGAGRVCMMAWNVEGVEEWP